MPNRKRKNQFKFYVDDEEKKVIYRKMKQLETDNLGSYLRKMAIDGIILNIDMTEIKKQNRELQRINTNINQIAKRINSTNTIYADDIKEIKEMIEEVWQSQRHFLLSLR